MTEHNIVSLWHVTFVKVNEKGEPLLNEDGSVKLFFNPEINMDLSFVNDKVNIDNLQEMSDGWRTQGCQKESGGVCHVQ